MKKIAIFSLTGFAIGFFLTAAVFPDAAAQLIAVPIGMGFLFACAGAGIAAYFFPHAEVVLRNDQMLKVFAAIVIFGYIGNRVLSSVIGGGANPDAPEIFFPGGFCGGGLARLLLIFYYSRKNRKEGN